MWNSLWQPLLQIWRKPLSPFQGFTAACVTVHNLICHVHFSDIFIVVLNYLRLHIFNFSVFLSCLQNICCLGQRCSNCVLRHTGVSRVSVGCVTRNVAFQNADLPRLYTKIVRVGRSLNGITPNSHSGGEWEGEEERLGTCACGSCAVEGPHSFWSNVTWKLPQNIIKIQYYH